MAKTGFSAPREPERISDYSDKHPPYIQFVVAVFHRASDYLRRTHISKYHRIIIHLQKIIHDDSISHETSRVRKQDFLTFRTLKYRPTHPPPPPGKKTDAKFEKNRISHPTTRSAASDNTVTPVQPGRPRPPAPVPPAAALQHLDECSYSCIDLAFVCCGVICLDHEVRCSLLCAEPLD